MLTLADRPIIDDDGQIIEGPDELEIAQKAEDAKRLKAYKASKPKEQSFDKFGNKLGLLG